MSVRPAFAYFITSSFINYVLRYLHDFMHRWTSYILLVFFLSIGICWKPEIVNESCPRFVVMPAVYSGFGDQLDRYIMHLHLAQLLHATLVPGGFTSGPVFHSGSDEYRAVARMLGIRFDLTLEQIMQDYNTTSRHISYSTIAYDPNFAAHFSDSLPCNVVIRAAMNGCAGPPPFTWCSTHPQYAAITSTAPYRNTVQLSHCPKLLHRRVRVMHVVWHVRSGDICLRCGESSDDIPYYTSLLSLIASALPPSYHLHVTFLSQEDLSQLRAYFPAAHFAVNTSLLSTACAMQRSDILITSGSSFAPLVAAFTSPLHRPLVFEEVRKEATLPYIHRGHRNVSRHFFSAAEAVLLENGKPTVSIVELKKRIRESLRRNSKLT